MELRLIWHRKSQRRKWNPFGGAPSLFPSPMFYAITAAASLTSFPWYLRNFVMGPHLPSILNHSLSNSLPWEKVAILKDLASSASLSQVEADVIPQFSWSRLEYGVSHLSYSPVLLSDHSSSHFPGTPHSSSTLSSLSAIFVCHSLIYHFSTWHTIFIPTCKHSHSSVSVPWSAYFLWFKR